MKPSNQHAGQGDRDVWANCKMHRPTQVARLGKRCNKALSFGPRTVIRAA
jgi:hypothetical protein